MALDIRAYEVPLDSLAIPSVVYLEDVDISEIPVGKPKRIYQTSNSHPAGKPEVETVGKPRVHIPGQDSFALPHFVQTTGRLVPAKVPRVTPAKGIENEDINPYSFSYFGKVQGLNHNNLNGLFQDRSGNLWIATWGAGVCKYNGTSFTHYTENDGFLDNRVFSTTQDSAGNYWFATNGGICKYDGLNFTHFTKEDGLLSNYVNSVYFDRDGNLWFSSWGGGIGKYDGTTLTQYTSVQGGPGESVNFVIQDSLGNMWFTGGGVGLCKFNDTSFVQFGLDQGLKSMNTAGILVDSTGNFWIGSHAGLVKYDGASFSHFAQTQGLPDNRIRSMTLDRKGHFWIGTTKGLSKFDGSSFTNYTQSHGLPDDLIGDVLYDRSGHLWIGTSKGLCRFDGGLFTHLPYDSDPFSSAVLSTMRDNTGNAWFGSRGKGILQYDGNAFVQYTDQQGLLCNSVTTMYQEEQGNIWFGTCDGVVKFDGISFTQFPSEPDVFISSFLSITQDKSGSLWFGTWRGVYKFDGESISHYNESEGLSGHDIWTSLCDKEGRMWFGTNNGLTCYDGTTFTHFTHANGFPAKEVFCSLEDTAGNLWFGTWGGGVVLYNGQDFLQLTEEHGLSNNFVMSAMQDTEGNLWFGTRYGLNRMSESIATDLARNSGLNDDERRQNIYFKNYNYENGFLGVGCTRGVMVEDRTGTIWIGADDRMTAYHPQGDLVDTSGMKIEITGLHLFNEEISWANILDNQDSIFFLSNGVKVVRPKYDRIGKWYGLPENLSLSHRNNYLTFDFVGVTMTQPGKLRYKYVMEGLDQNWSALTSDHFATYGNIPSGDYTFRVKALNSAGKWSSEASYAFSIRPPWWRTLWAYVIYGVLLLILAWQIHVYQRSRVLRIERERTRERELAQAKEIEKAYTQLEAAHENLKATQAQLIQSEKMASLGEMTAGIAHEIQNPLNFVNNFSEVNKELLEEMREALTKGDIPEAISIYDNLLQNEEKVIQHGKRADGIVKSMLQHSRGSKGQRELTDLNSLCDEYIRLAFHGLRAKDKSFNAEYILEVDESIPKIEVVPQDIGRVLLNLINNAFYAVTEKRKDAGPEYKPKVTVSTHNLGGNLEIHVRDNGKGIPDHIVDKLFQPFFTTKPTGQGTGLGLSLSYDIVKAHGGDIKVESEKGVCSTFIVTLPR